MAEKLTVSQRESDRAKSTGPFLPVRLAPSRSVLKEPYSEKPATLGVSRPRLVVMLITPPMASDPHSILWLPRRISIRSLLSVVRKAKSDAPVVALLTIAPLLRP